MVAHIHAELMKQYAEDALETECPWERWEALAGKNPDIWKDLFNHPCWYSDCHYRRKPRTIKIGSYDVPEPLRVAPEVGTSVWAVCTSYKTPRSFHWSVVSDYCYHVLNSGLLHSTKESAEIHLKALIEVSGGTM